MPDKPTNGLRPGQPLAGLQDQPTEPAKPPKPPKARDARGRILPTDNPSKGALRSRKSRKKRAQLRVPQSLNRRITVPGPNGFDANRARKKLNTATILALQDAFDRGGQAAIDEVMREHPAIFLKMLVLLVPRELEIQHSGGVKGMSDEALEAAIEALERMLNAKVIEGVAEEPSASTP